MRTFEYIKDKNCLFCTPKGSVVFKDGKCECDGEIAEYVACHPGVVETTPKSSPKPASKAQAAVPKQATK